MVQTAFQDGVLIEEPNWQMVVLILKGGGEYRGTGLVEVVWKAVAAIINIRFTFSTTYRNSLHGFWEVRGFGTATLKIKLFQQVTAMRLHTTFLDMHKAYYAFDRSRSLKVLEGHGMGPI